MDNKDVAVAAERLLARCTESPDGCWVFQGGRTANGYSQVGHARRIHLGHRIVWQYLRGEIPPGLSYDHLCRNKACVNPWHGELVTLAVNTKRNAWANKPSCKNGHLYTPESLVIGANGYKVCLVCKEDRRKGPSAACRNGHLYTPENTGTGHAGRRRCLTCFAIRAKKAA